VFVGEKAINKFYSSATTCGMADDCFGYAAGWNFSTVRFGNNPPQADIRNPQVVDMGGRFGSSHIGSCLFVFGDGHVASISFGVSQTVFAYLCHIADGQSFGDDDY
jgi:hypothetical protein